MSRLTRATAMAMPASEKRSKSRSMGCPMASPISTSTGATNRAIWAALPSAMESERSIWPRTATDTALACSEALPISAIRMTPTNVGVQPSPSVTPFTPSTNNSDRYATPMVASSRTITERRTLQSCTATPSFCSCAYRWACVRSEKTRPAPYPSSSTMAATTLSRSTCGALMGDVAASTAGISRAPAALAAVRSKRGLSRFSPPRKQARPSTARMLPRMEPINEALTTSVRLACKAKKAMISSVALPNVAFKSPPAAAPRRPANCSVLAPMRRARGTMARPLVKNSAAGLQCSDAAARAKGAASSKGSSGCSDLSLLCTYRSRPRRLNRRVDVDLYRAAPWHQGKCQGKNAADIGLACHVNLATVGASNPVGQGQPEAAVLRAVSSCFIDPVEGLEKMRQMLRGNAPPGISHLHRGMPALVVDDDADGAALGRVRDGVVQQVGQKLAKLEPVAAYRQLCARGDLQVLALAFDQWPDAIDRLLDHVPEVQ